MFPLCGTGISTHANEGSICKQYQFSNNTMLCGKFFHIKVLKICTFSEQFLQYYYNNRKLYRFKVEKFEKRKKKTNHRMKDFSAYGFGFSRKQIELEYRLRASVSRNICPSNKG